MKQREYETLKAQIKAECQTKLDALELVWKISAKAVPSDSPITGRGAVRQAVKSAAAIVHGPFTTADIERHIKETNSPLGARIKRASISNTLKKLVNEKIIEVVEQGTGRQGSTYRLRAN
jgi:hypothetical protein